MKALKRIINNVIDFIFCLLDLLRGELCMAKETNMYDSINTVGCKFLSLLDNCDEKSRKIYVYVMSIIGASAGIGVGVGILTYLDRKDKREKEFELEMAKLNK